MSSTIRFQPLRTGSDFENFIGEFTNYERMKEYRYAGDTLSLERMGRLARDLGDPAGAYPSVHIAGTKGKGSTSLILEALLAASGLRAGTYTSPHVESVRERIRFDGESIGEAELCALTNSILPALEAAWPEGPVRFPTFFELMTALAMLHFRRRGASWGIFEVGLGGRLDATNILRPRWTAITSIGLEHTDKLGGTLSLIAGEKAGIIKEGTPLVLGEVPPEAEEVIRRIARERRAPVASPSPGTVRRSGHDRIEVRLGAGEGRGERNHDPAAPAALIPWASIPAGAIRGPALRADLAIALFLWRGALAPEGREPAAAEIERALATLRLPARVEIFDGDPPVIIDGAHTTESIRALAVALDEIALPAPRTLVFALAADKPAEPILRELPSIGAEAIFTRADAARGRGAQELAVLSRQTTSLEARAIEDPLEAFAEARRRGRPVVVTGSFYLAGKLRGVARSLTGER